MTLQSDFSAKITKVKTALENVFVKKTDITTSFSSTTSDSKIPSEKLVKNSLDDKISKSQTSGLVKNDGTIDRTNYLSSLPSHNHDDRYYTETEINSALNGKANSTHLHSISDVTNLQTSLDDKAEESDLLDLIYPIGSIYMKKGTGTTSVCPIQQTLGGTWTRIENRFLYASEGEQGIGTTGGSATVTLTAAQSGVPAHSHGMAHTHTHNHTAIGYTNTGGAGTARRNPIGYDNTSAAGTLTTSSDRTASSKSDTDNNTAQNASEAHDNMPPYIIVNVWERTA